MAATAAPRTKAETLAWLRTHLGRARDGDAQAPRGHAALVRARCRRRGARRSGLVAQAGIIVVHPWYDDPDSTPWIAADVFGAAPRELLRIGEPAADAAAHPGDGRGRRGARRRTAASTLREAILLYSREIAFAAADVYARAAEARGLWDARLEALVVDSILTGEADDELPSRIAALGWHGHGEVAVLVGTTPPQLDVDQLRRTARKLGATC